MRQAQFQAPAVPRHLSFPGSLTAASGCGVLFPPANGDTGRATDTRLYSGPQKSRRAEREG